MFSIAGTSPLLDGHYLHIQQYYIINPVGFQLEKRRRPDGGSRKIEGIQWDVFIDF
jgi:hypothetical protein